MRKEVDVAVTVAATERSEAAPEGGGPGVLPQKFLRNLDCKCCNLRYSVASFVPRNVNRFNQNRRCH